MKKKFKYYKFLILFAFVSLFSCFIGFSCNAWSVGSDGNLHSDNILTFTNGSYNGLGINFVCEDNKITLNGTASSSGPLWVNINVEPGTYTFQVFNDFTFDNDFRLTLRNGYDRILSSCDYSTLNNYNTYTSTYSATILAISVVGGVTYDNVVLTPSLVVGSTPLRDYEPYNAIYYSETNYLNYPSDLLGGLESFDAINLYYLDSETFVSNDNGNTFVSANSQDVTNTLLTRLDGSRFLQIDKSNPWGYSNIYYTRIDFAQPVFLWRLRINNSYKPTEFLKVVADDLEITHFNYLPGSSSSYVISDNIYKQVTSVDFYYKINGYTNSATQVKSFNIYYDGYNIGINSYKEGYEKGQSDLQPIIDDLKSNINVLKSQIDSLNTRLSENFGWQSLFFSMADTPFYTVSKFLGFEVLGVNLFNCFIGFITVLAVLWVLKRLVK